MAIRIAANRDSQGGPGSVSVTFLGVEWFERFRFSVPPVPPQKGFFFLFLCFSTVNKKGRFRFGSWKTVPTVPVSGSGSVPEPPWIQDIGKSHPCTNASLRRNF